MLPSHTTMFFPYPIATVWIIKIFFRIVMISPIIVITHDFGVVRALATRVLGLGEMRTRTGSKRVWVDKSLGRYRLVPVLEVRALDPEGDVVPVLLNGLEDRAGVVRAAALDGLLARNAVDRISEDMIAALCVDPARAVRWRADYCARKRLGET